jgi:uncharacterized damage-inducible protein DinB
MNDDFHSLFGFNRWANAHMLAGCRKLAAEQYAAEPMPGWSSVRSAVVHIAQVTDGWLCALFGQPVAENLPETAMPAVDDAERVLDHAYGVLGAHLPALTPEQLAAPRTIIGRGRTAVLPPWVVLRHVVNHTTYHRGQVASKLRRFGIEQPATDLVFWAFEQMPEAANGWSRS